MSPPVILHVDCDAFFAAIEQRDRPELRGKPVIVGADPLQGQGRGVVSTCSYEARRFGIHSAMPISQAYQRCPQAVFLRGDFAKYRAVSDEIFKIFDDYTPHIEPISIDEAFLDVTGSFHLFTSPFQLARHLKKAILRQVGLTVSVGIAPVKFVAKIASDYCKPDGLLQIKPDEVLSFLWPLAVDQLWGVGPKTRQVLEGCGIRTIGDLAQMPADRLEDLLGENGLHLHRLAHGIDSRTVETDAKMKSVSHEHTFGQDTRSLSDIEGVLLKLSEKVSRRLRRYGLKGRTLTLKIRLKDFKTFTRAKKLSLRTNYADVIYKETIRLLMEFYRPGMAVRLVGVRLTGFDDAYAQESLFSDPLQAKREHIHQATDLIQDRYGEGSIRRARPVQPIHETLKG